MLCMSMQSGRARGHRELGIYTGASQRDAALGARRRAFRAATPTTRLYDPGTPLPPHPPQAAKAGARIYPP